MGEEELLERLKIADEEAFLELVNKYKQGLVSLCYSYTHDLYEAEDLSQEVFIAVYKNISSFRGDSSLKTYLYRIGVNKCLSYKRKRGLKDFITDIFSGNESSVAIDLDEKSYIRQCIKDLSIDIRTPLVLYYYIGLNYSEIGKILDITERAVEGRIYRAKQKLKARMEKEGVVFWKEKALI